MEKLLIIRFSAMGDVAMMVPVVKSLAQQYPNLQITVLSKPFYRFFFDGLASNVHFMGADIKKEYKGIRGLNKLYRRLIAKRFTAVADFHDVLRSKYLRLRFNMGMFKTAHINKHHCDRRKLTCNNHKEFKQLPTSFENYTEVLQNLGYPIKIEFKSIFDEGKGNINIISDRIVEKNSGETWIGIAPFAAHEGKIYPKKNLKKTISLLLEREPNCRLFFFGSGEKEYAIIEELIDNNTKCINASSVLKNLREELILMSHLDVMLSMDSSNMHLASLVGTRVVSVWGATHRYAGFLGWNQSVNDVIELEIPCRPCCIFGDKKCQFGDYRCMNIPHEKIVDAILRS